MTVAVVPEGVAARTCFTRTPDVPGAVAGCSSGLETARGRFAEVVCIACELAACTVVPVLTDGAFGSNGPAEAQRLTRLR